jgi:hypothetical protein
MAARDNTLNVTEIKLCWRQYRQSTERDVPPYNVLVPSRGCAQPFKHALCVRWVKHSLCVRWVKHSLCVR